MIAEVANALFLTYAATEYTIASQDAKVSKRFMEYQKDDPLRWNLHTNQNYGRYKRWIIATGIVLLMNVLDEVLGVTTVIAKFLSNETYQVVHWLWHIPRVVVAAGAYLTTLFWDCQRTMARQRQHLTFCKDFLPRVLSAFFVVLPIYPLAAIFISFGFLILITIFDALHLPESLLNWPIYYGTLYGPFSYIYHIVKLSVVNESQLGLPKSSSFGDGGFRLGG